MCSTELEDHPEHSFRPDEIATDIPECATYQQACNIPSYGRLHEEPKSSAGSGGRVSTSSGKRLGCIAVEYKLTRICGLEQANAFEKRYDPGPSGNIGVGVAYDRAAHCTRL